MVVDYLEVSQEAVACLSMWQNWAGEDQAFLVENGRIVAATKTCNL